MLGRHCVRGRAAGQAGQAHAARRDGSGGWRKSTPDFDKGEFVDAEEEEVELWESNFGCANMRDQWVVYRPAPWRRGGGGTGASSANAIDLTMHDARVQADALCAPMSMF